MACKGRLRIVNLLNCKRNQWLLLVVVHEFSFDSFRLLKSLVIKRLNEFAFGTEKVTDKGKLLVAGCAQAFKIKASSEIVWVVVLFCEQ